MSEESARPFSEAYAALEALRALATTWNDSPPMRQLGARLEFERVDRVRDAINGPVLAGLFDLVIGTVGWLTRPETRSATVSLAMTFLRPTRGARVVVEARLLRAGTNLTFAAAEVIDERGEITARCDGTVAVAHGKFESNDFYAAMRGRQT